MKIPFLGLEISRAKALSQVSQRGGWHTVFESFAGAWQMGVEVKRDTVLTYSAVYACVTLIASDIAKLRPKLVKLNKQSGVWTETEDARFSPVLARPNPLQNRIKFLENWVTSKLIFGNTYVLKVRDDQGVVRRLYVLDPQRVKVLVADNGDVYYEINRDNLTGQQQESVTLPASEIIHDVMVPLHHPLVGVSPIHACGLAATQGLRIQQNSARFFANGAAPSGILTATGAISNETAARLKAQWQQDFTGENIGKIAVAGDGLKFEPITIPAADAQLIEQLKWTAETVCSCFHVPAYMVGIGAPPSYNNIEALNQQYYTQCLQGLIEQIELLLDEGLGMTEAKGVTLGTELDLDALLRMDTATKVKSVADSIKAGFLKPNEARAKFDLEPVKGGDTPYLQQQNYSLAALDARDSANPAPSGPSPAAADPPANDNEGKDYDATGDDAEQRAAYDAQISSALRIALHSAS